MVTVFLLITYHVCESPVAHKVDPRESVHICHGLVRGYEQGDLLTALLVPEGILYVRRGLAKHGSKGTAKNSRGTGHDYRP